jgi:starvation-inducible DNA-binding protein
MDTRSNLPAKLPPDVRRDPRGDYLSDLGSEAVAALAPLLRQLLADVFVLYVKTKGFHWHIGGRHFRDYHLLLDEQADQLFAMTDVIAERSRKLGAVALRSIGDVVRHQRLCDCDAADLTAADMLRELRGDSLQLTRSLRQTHAACDRYGDTATASLIENWIDEAERRTWFLSEVLHGLDGQGRNP